MIPPRETLELMATRFEAGQIVRLRDIRFATTGRALFDEVVQIQNVRIVEGDITLNVTVLREYEGATFRLSRCEVIPIINGKSSESLAWTMATYGASPLTRDEVQRAKNADWDAEAGKIFEEQ